MPPICFPRVHEHDLLAAGLYGSSKPMIKSNTLLPYYFRSNSPLRGTVAHDETYSGGRRVIVVNVDDHGELSNQIPDGYLGGDHDEEELDFMTKYLRGSIERKDVFASRTPQEQRFARVCWPVRREESDEHVSQEGPLDEDASDEDESYESEDDTLMEELYISSPFPKKWPLWFQRGPNVAICVSRDGRYLNWATKLKPEDGHVVSRISLSQIPLLESFDPKTGFGKGYSCELEDIYEGAWVMTGNYLGMEVHHDDLPNGVIDRLRGGFFRCEEPTFMLDPMKLYSRLSKLTRSLTRMSPTSRAALGFRSTEQDGVYDCKLASVAKLMDVNVEVLAAHIAEPRLAYLIFQGLVGYAAREFTVPLRVCEPTPVGEWMVGSLFGTGSGLVYNDYSKTYHTVRTVGDTSYLGVCTEGIAERRPLVL